MHTVQHGLLLSLILFYLLYLIDHFVDLLGRLTVSEKISQLGNSAASIDNLTIPAYQW